MKSIHIDQSYRQALRDRFLRYVKIETTSDSTKAETPSTSCQWNLINLLEQEMKDLGMVDLYKDEHGYLIGRIPASPDGGSQAPVIGLMAHVDTSEDSSGRDVHPLLHSPYDGKDITLPAGQLLSVEENPELLRYKGETVITTDGNTLLGADDKAGIAEILTAAAYLKDHPEVIHGEIEVIFTPDEETGTGMDLFPLKELRSQCCYTMDGGKEGELETECYYAHKGTVHFTGRAIHPGYGRGKLVNAVSMASAFINMLPRTESPEATDGRYGNYWPHAVKGGIEEAELVVYMRDFDLAEGERRCRALSDFARAVEAAFPGGKVAVETKLQYANMKEELDKNPKVVEIMEEAVRLTGVEPDTEIIRGGTDGSRLTAMGIPTPNVFAGGHNFHSRKEWIGVPALVRAVDSILNLVHLWAEESR